MRHEDRLAASLVVPPPACAEEARVERAVISLVGEDLLPEPHEDISQEHQPLASTVGRAFYEVPHL